MEKNMTVTTVGHLPELMRKYDEIAGAAYVNLYTLSKNSDTITIAKLLDGSDGYYITLTNQAHVVPCDENGNYNSSDLENVKTEIHVYRGATEVGFSFSKVDKGCASIYNSSTKTLSLTTLTNDSATVTITITVNNKSFVKVMSSHLT